MNRLNSQKAHFNLRDGEHYLNCAYKAPLLKSAEEACLKALIRERNPMDITAETCFEEMPTVRQYFGEIINAEASRIAIVPSASYGFTSILNNTQAKKNGHAITVKDEFPSGYLALKKWCSQNDNELKVVSPNPGHQQGRSWQNNILDSINEQTSVVLMSSVHYMNGIKYDLESIGLKCKAVGAQFIVDGTQSVGAMTMDVKTYHIDALVCAGYKWLLGPYSTALTYFSDYYDHGEPIEEAWLNRKNSNIFSKLSDYEEAYRPHATRYNVGETSNFILMPILRTGLKQIIEWTPESIQQYCADLIKPLKAFLKTLNIELEEDAFFCNHIFALQLPKTFDIEKLKENLVKNKIHISVRGDYLRISINVYNDENDIQKLIDTISEMETS